ncbi:MAG: HAMP domain-containing sensor histidine kinase [Acidimicrobiales bacterium]
MSLRARLLLGVLVVGMALAVAAVAITQATRQNLIQQVDEQLTRSTPEGRGERRPDADDDGYPTPGTTPPGAIASSLYVGVLEPGADDLVTVSRPNLLTSSEAIPDLHGDEAARHVGGEPFTVGAEDGDLSFRVQVRAAGPDGRLAVFALPLTDVEETIRRLLLIQAAAAAAILGTLGLVTFWVLRLGVRPVREMTHTAMAIGEGDLSQRIPETAPGTEAGELGLALNQMLGRIEEAFDERSRSEDRLRQFVADASHELRTPVTTIRGYAELYRMGGLAEQTALDEAMRRTEQEASRMGQLVADLLDLARLDQGRPLQVAPVDLAELVADGAADLRAVEPDRPVSVEAAGPVAIVGDEALLRQIVANLTTNARVHTPAGTPIHLRVRPDQAGGAVLEVADEGPGMAPDVAARAFERFYRADPARARQTGGSGLGLSIVAGTVAAHGGHVELDSAPGRGTCVRIALPAVPPTAPPADPDAGADGPDGR